MSGTTFGFDTDTLTAFDKAYWASQPLLVQKLNPNITNDYNTRLTMANTLAGQGFFIDVPVMVWGWDAYMTMWMRQFDGYTTYPDGLNAQTRKVSLDLADYPPVVIPTPAAGVLVGAQIAPGSPYFFLTTLASESNLPAGYETGLDATNSGHQYILIMITQQTFSSSQQIPRWIQIS